MDKSEVEKLKIEDIVNIPKEIKDKIIEETLSDLKQLRQALIDVSIARDDLIVSLQNALKNCQKDTMILTSTSLSKSVVEIIEKYK